MEERHRASEEALALLREELARREQLAAQRKDLCQQRVERRHRLETTAEILRREQKDVDTLEGIHPRAIWLRLTGDREVQLSKEKREAAAALLQYEQAEQDLADLDRRLAELEREAEPLGDVEHRYEEALARKRALLREAGGARGEAIAALEEKLGAAHIRRKELGEALAAGRQADEALARAADSLGSAEGWGMWDMFGGGLISDLAKHGHIDDARGHIGAAQHALSRFRTELADVGQIDAPGIQIGDFASFADWFFDGIFADVFVQGRINDAQGEVTMSRHKVGTVLARLAEMDRKEAKDCLALERELSTLTEEG